jgi:hypothetical protein
MNDEQLNHHLDELRRNEPQAPPHLVTRILANTPEATAAERLTAWLTAGIWRGAAAAVLPLLVGFVLGVTGSSTAADDLSTWYAAEDLVYAGTIEEYDYDEI